MARRTRDDVFDVGGMDDDELRDVVVQRLREQPNIDAGWIEVDVRDGQVRLSGRVGTDAEVRIAENVLHDVIGVDDYENELVVDELHRGQAPRAADAALARETAANDPLGTPNAQHSDTADHLVEDAQAESFGTRDSARATRDGLAYRPPDEPMADGYESREDH